MGLEPTTPGLGSHGGSAQPCGFRPLRASLRASRSHSYAPRGVANRPRFNDPTLANLAQEPLSDLARAQHRNVLLVSSLAILIAQLNLVPKKISALGVDLQSSDRNAIRIALLLAVVYLLVAFLTSAVADYAEWVAVKREAREMHGQVRAALSTAEVEEREVWAPQLANDPDKQTDVWSRYGDHQNNVALWTNRTQLYSRLEPVSRVRTFLDFVLPIALSVTAVIELLVRLT
jgi:hypothetical protein